MWTVRRRIVVSDRIFIDYYYYYLQTYTYKILYGTQIIT